MSTEVEVVKNKVFYTAKYDRIFKTIFVNEKDYHLMEALLSECLGEEIKIVKYNKVELDVKTTKERTKRLDVIVRAKDRYLNIELNTKGDDLTRVRNLNFFTAFFSSRTNRNETYDEDIEYIQINLSYKIAKSKRAISTYTLKNEDNEEYVKNFKIMEVNLDRIKNEWYANDKKGTKYRYLLMLDLNQKELEELSRKDIIVKEYMERIVDLNNDDVFIPPVSYEEDEALLQEAYRRRARKEGLEEGIKEGRAEGLETGARQEKIKIAKNMINLDIDIDTIVKSTGLTIEEIKNIK